MKYSFLAIFLLMISLHNLFAQENPNQPYFKQQQIIIQKNGDNTQNFSIEMNGDQVLINGVPAEEYKDSSIIIKRNGQNIFSPDSETNTIEKVDTVAFLGVVTNKNEKGAEIISIEPHSPAEESSLQKGDIIKSINGETIADQNALSKIIRAQKPRSEIQITYLHGEEQKTATVKLGLKKTIERNTIERKMIFSDEDLNLAMIRSGNNDKPKLGVRLEDTQDSKGVRVIDVTDEMPAAKAGLMIGDILTQIDETTVNQVSDAKKAFYKAYQKDSFKIKFERKGKLMEKSVYIPRKPKTIDL